MEYEDVAYWNEVCEIMDWSRSHVWSTFHICWGAFAGLYHHYGIKKYYERKKVFGVFKHHLNVKMKNYSVVLMMNFMCHILVI